MISRFLLVAFLFWGTAINAFGVECDFANFSKTLKQVFDPRYGVTKEKPLEQWLDWEIYANHQQYRRKQGQVKIPFVEVDEKNLEIFVANKTGENVLRHLKVDGKVRFFKHPFNTDSKTPFFKIKPAGEIEGHLTASRSIFANIGDLRVSIKTPTNRPFAKKNVWWPWEGKQPQKVNLSHDVETAPQFSRLIESLEAGLPQKSHQNILKDVIGIRDRVTGNGMIIRDLSLLKKDHYYLPGQAIPFAGRSLKGDFFKNISEGFLEPRGKMDAKMFLDYGFVMHNPTPQNYLVELGQNQLPTGQVFMRDLQDQYLSEIHHQYFERTGKLKGIKFKDQDIMKFSPTTQNGKHDILQNFDLSVGDGDIPFMLSGDEMDQFHKVYTKSYIDEFNRSLNQNFKSLREIEDFVNSERGETAIQNYLSRRYR